MKIFCWVSILALILAVAPPRLAAQGKALTNQDVVDLVKTGLSNDIVIAKINSSACQFDTSPPALRDLKAAGVADNVILAMVQSSSKAMAPAPVKDLVSGPVVSSEFAYVHVYRPKFLPGSNFSPPILVDDKQVATLPNGKRFTVRVTPGPHVIKSDDKSSEISIDAKGGQEFYISIQELPGGFLKGRGKMTMMANEQGRPEYKLEKPLEDERKTAKDMIENDVETPDASTDKPASK